MPNLPPWGLGAAAPVQSQADLRRGLRILHLEDATADRELVCAVLADAGFACQFSYAINQREFAAALESGPFDLILSDFTLPGYDGAAALAFARSRVPEVPYIIVSGTIGIDRAVDCLKQGASDYVLKDGLGRLIPAVSRALAEVAERTQRQAAEKRFREMAENIRDVFWTATPDGRSLTYVSPAFEQVFGHPIAELVAQPALWLENVVEEDRPRVEAALGQLKEGNASRAEYRIVRSDGTTRWIEGRGYPLRDYDQKVTHTVGIATDITDRKQLESQLLQAQKMEAIGQLAGGVAHDFNNILTVIIGNAGLMLNAGNLSPDQEKFLKQIYTAGERAASLTRQLLMFSRKQAVNRCTLDVNKVIEEVAQMLGRLIGENIRLELILPTGVPPVVADAAMMEQILMNLAVNARDAMPKGGLLSIATKRVALDDIASYEHPARRPGDFVSIKVRDTGAGIPADVLPRMFEPFFTTKAPGDGTGLGLATVFGIVQLHEGWIEVESPPGQGASFEIFLPAVMDPLVVPVNSASPFVLRGGKETVLLVEDERPVREFAVAVLEHFGYRVLQAASGVQALEVWKWHAAKISLLLTDLVMPDGMTGVELAQRLHGEKPALRVVFTSGYSSEMASRVFALQHEIPFLQKPYVPETLSRAVRDALDKSTP
ncbi:MAG: Multi-sensor hybrid histidine kinase [Verrucomicrobia bacterium]|nr:Multi-sensor hybrid histidine kinase [Verrucomicrobiota bacterium]